MSCPSGGFPSIHHNEIKYLTAKVLTETCHNVAIEPPLQPINDEHFCHKTAYFEHGARLGIAADNVGEMTDNRLSMTYEYLTHMSPLIL